jgi:hypothetical protein
VANVRYRWPALTFVGLVLAAAVYVIWAIGNPARGGAFHVMAAPPVAPEFLLMTAVFLGLAPLLRPEEDGNEILAGAVALTNSALCYGIFLLHTARAFSAGFAALNVAASLVFLGMAVVFWARLRSRVSVFFYAMAGYVALSFAIIKVAAMPDVFVWLSLQSLVVMATAV